MAESALKRAVFTDRHVVIALLVAPVLAIASWYAVGWLAGDLAEPEVAESGQAYPLLERSGCRYEGGQCRVSNGDFMLTLTVGTMDNEGAIYIQSALPLESLLMGLRSSGDGPPLAAQRQTTNTRDWVFLAPGPIASDDALRIVAVAGGAAYFGEVSLTFTEQRQY